jgi:hypothetical protein
MRSVLIAVAAVLALAALLAPGASAHTKKYSTSTTLTQTAIPNSNPNATPMATYSGTVTSSSQRCVANRTVYVSVPDGILSTVTTDGSGNWATPPVVAAADGVAVAKKFLKKNSDHKHYCKQTGFFF